MHYRYYYPAVNKRFTAFINDILQYISGLCTVNVQYYKQT